MLCRRPILTGEQQTVDNGQLRSSYLALNPIKQQKKQTVIFVVDFFNICDTDVPEI